MGFDYGPPDEGPGEMDSLLGNEALAGPGPDPNVDAEYRKYEKRREEDRKALGFFLKPETWYAERYRTYWDLLAWFGIAIEFLAQCLYSAMEGDAPTDLITALEFIAGILLTMECIVRALALPDFFFKKTELFKLQDDDEDAREMFAQAYQGLSWFNKIKWMPNFPNYFDLIAGPGSLTIDIITFIAEGELNQIGSFMRIFRVLTLPGVRVILTTSFRAIPKLLTTLLGSVCLLFMFAFIGKYWFHEEFPDQFGNVVKSLFELFVVATLDQWSAITRDVIQEHPHAWIFFVCAVLLFGFIMLNIFMGVVLGVFLNNDSGPETVARPYPPNTIKGQIHVIRDSMAMQRHTFSNRMTLLEKRIFLLKKRLEARAQEEAEN